MFPPVWGVTPARDGLVSGPGCAWRASAYDVAVVVRTAVIVDQWALVRVGIGTILRQMSIRVVADEGRGRDGLAHAGRHAADLVVLGSHLDLATADAVRGAKALVHAPLVIALLPQPDADDLAAVLAARADAVLLRSADGDE